MGWGGSVIYLSRALLGRPATVTVSSERGSTKQYHFQWMASAIDLFTVLLRECVFLVEPSLPTKEFSMSLPRNERGQVAWGRRTWQAMQFFGASKKVPAIGGIRHARHL